jgi:hypothetical protein
LASHPPPNSGYQHTIIFPLIHNTTTTCPSCMNNASQQMLKSPLEDSRAQ